MAQEIFVNLPIKDLDKTIEFFEALGFSFDPRFTNENATCMIIGENMYAMLLVEDFFMNFIPGKEISDASKTEVLLAISLDSREVVDEMVEQAKAAGGKEYNEVQDHGWMYSRTFEDIDGHIWEVMHTDESKMPEEMKNKEEQ